MTEKFTGRTVLGPNFEVSVSSLAPAPNPLPFHTHSLTGQDSALLLLRASMLWASPRPGTLAKSPFQISLLLPSPACQTPSLSSHQEDRYRCNLTYTNV